MKLRHVEVFQAVMETGSMSAAGRLLQLSQPAVSRIVASTEEALGYALFQRVNGRLEPTTEAAILFEAGSALIEKLQAFKRTTVQLRGGDLGKLHVAAIPAICHRLLPRVMGAFRRAHPVVPCEIHTLHKRQIVDDLVAGAADLGFDFFGISHPGVESRVLGTGPLYVLAPAPGGPNAPPRALDDEALRRYMSEVPMIGLVDNDPIATLFNRWCERHGVEARTHTLVQTSELAEALVARGMGWTVADFVTAATCGPDIRATALRPTILCTLNSFIVAGRVPSPLARRFSALVHAELQAMTEAAAATQEAAAKPAKAGRAARRRPGER